MWCFWTVKGGSGASVTAAAAALWSARSHPTLLVDLCGDQCVLLGLDPSTQPTGPPTLADWLDHTRGPVAPDALGRLEVEAGPGLSVLPWPEATPAGDAIASTSCDSAGRFRLLAAVLAADRRRVVLDVGRRSRGRSDGGLGEAVLAVATRSTLVTRACYLGLRQVGSWPRPDSVALVAEPGRSLRAADVEAAVGAPVTTIRYDPAVARAVDAGLATTRLPRALAAVRLLDPARARSGSPDGG